jgi:hypothetical protein
MEDSSHKQVVDQPTTESKINRRDMAKLLGAVTALSASLGVTFVTSAATVSNASNLSMKFYRQAPNGDPAKAQLLCTLDVSPEDQRKIVSAGGPVEMRLVQVYLKLNDPKARAVPQEVTVSSQTIPNAALIEIKQHIERND